MTNERNTDDRAPSEGQNIERVMASAIRGLGTSSAFHFDPEEGHTYTVSDTAYGNALAALSDGISEIQRLRTELAEVKYWNGAIAVCQEHVEDIVSEDPASCVVCDLERLRAALSEQEPVAWIVERETSLGWIRCRNVNRTGLVWVDAAEAQREADAWRDDGYEARVTPLARTQSPKEGER